MISSFRCFRHGVFAQSTCFCLAAFLWVGQGTVVFAQTSSPLHVDPVLLGLPPLKKADIPPARPSESGKSSPESSSSEIRTVDAPEVEARPIENVEAAPMKNRGIANSEKTDTIRPEKIPENKTDSPPLPEKIENKTEPLISTLPSEKTETAKTPDSAIAAPVVSEKSVSAPEPQLLPEQRVSPAALKRDVLSSSSETPDSEGSARRFGGLRVDPRLLGYTAVVKETSRPAVLEHDPSKTPLPADGAYSSDIGRDESLYAVDEASDDLPPLALRLSRNLRPASEGSDDAPAFLIADRVDGNGEREMNAWGAAELRKPGTVVKADHLTYWPIEDEIQGEGNARLEQGQDVISGPKMRMKMEDKVGFFEQPTFRFHREPRDSTGKFYSPSNTSVQQLSQGDDQEDEDQNAGFATPVMTDFKRINSTAIARTYADMHGTADRIDLESENHYHLTNSRFTTCKPDDNDWYLQSDELKLDFDKEEGRSKGGVLYFKDVPILYSPILPFALNKARRSGFLAPSFGVTSNVGAMIRTPYYWNIAPNMDAIVTPQMLLRRGVLLDSEIRYIDRALGGTYSGMTRMDILPSDKLRDGENRYAISMNHAQTTASGFYGYLNYNKVSDDKFFTDLSSNISMTSQAQLLQQGLLSYYGGGWWNATANFQRYQTLQPDPKNPVLEQYRIMPQITLNARKLDFHGTDSRFMGQYSSFSKPKQMINGVLNDPPVGKRLVLYPQVALPFVKPGWYVTPKFGVNMRRYALSGGPVEQPKTISTTLPIFSVDSGMNFERKSNWFNREYTQTLEPRLYYLNIPYRDQSKIPVFDSALADFSFAQIFSENQFSSWDRISNANQLTAAVTSRLFDHRNGVEIMRMMIGQRFYFSRNRVSLLDNPIQGQENRKWEKSDFLTSFGGQIYPYLYADFSSQYNLSEQRAKRHSISLRYLPAPGKVLNASYRYNRDEAAPINQVDFSGQWPIGGRLYTVGRLNYSFKDTGATFSTAPQSGRMVQTVAGVEYKGNCWVARGVMQRLALTQNSASTAFFIQLELNDFASIGSNPILILRRNIQGFGLVNEPVTDSSFLGQ